jgi:L-2-hydroxyglutarate oxidase
VIYDYCVIGGMVGLATAMKLLEMRPKASMLLKSEGHVTAHRIGHNSGVIHPGIY